MSDKIMTTLASATGGKSYRAHKYGLDHAERPFIDYGEDSIIWERTAETDKTIRRYVPLADLSRKLAARNEQLLTYFLDGSRRVFKVDDIAYAHSGGRSVIYPVIAGQIGVGCCRREHRQMVPEKFKREFVLSIPDIANADGKAGFFSATAKKLNNCSELRRLGIEFSTILPYRTAKNSDKKFEDRGTACVQDRMAEKEKELVAELVREGKLNQNNIGIQNQIRYIDEHFGPQKDLYLMDNNVFASKCFNKIIDEINACGFGKGASFLPPNEYEVAIKNLQANYNPRAYIRKIIGIYDQIAKKLPEDEAGDFYLRREADGLLYVSSATAEHILDFDDIARPLYSKYFPKKRTARYIDFNQGLDARLVTAAKMEKLSEINIRPLRIAFDHYEQRDIYVEAVRKAAEYHITDLSNYLLYNFEDKPEELYYRMRINVDLCEELGVTIYSFPMKYHPISDPEYFRNRDYIGKHWNRKFIRSVQAVLNSTKGKIGRGVDFFEEAFGRDVDEFKKILWMPETFIVYRRVYDADLRERLADRYTGRTAHDCDLANEWWEKFSRLPPEKAEKAKEIIALNKFKDGDFVCNDQDVLDILSYYRITRDDAER